MRTLHRYRKLPPKRPRLAPLFAEAIAGVGDLPPLPDKCNQSAGITDWGIDGNDDAGDCVECAAAHAEMLWSANATGTPLAITSDQVIAEYTAETGYNPQTGANDNGTQISDMLSRWQSVGLFGNRIAGFCEIDANNRGHFQRAINDLGCVVMGVRLPASAEYQFDQGQVWTAGGMFDRIVGGHCILAVSYGPDGFQVVTWGKLQPVDWSFIAPYCDEAYACVSPLFLGAQGTTKGGLTLDVMTKELGALAAA